MTIVSFLAASALRNISSKAVLLGSRKSEAQVVIWKTYTFEYVAVTVWEDLLITMAASG